MKNVKVEEVKEGLSKTILVSALFCALSFSALWAVPLMIVTIVSSLIATISVSSLIISSVNLKWVKATY